MAAVFAAHPLRVESVAWVTERKDVLLGLFFMLTLAAYLGYVRRPFAPGRYLLVLACFAAGLAAKPMAVTLPLVLLLLDYWPLGRFSDRLAARLIWEKLPLLAIAGLFGLLAVHGQAGALEINRHVPVEWRIGNVLLSYVFYLGKLFYPVGLAVLYPTLPELGPWRIAGSALLLISCTAAALAGWRRFPYLLVGWLWYLGMMLPVIGVVQLGLGNGADRFTYLPQIGLTIALAWAAAAVWERGEWRAERGEGRAERGGRRRERKGAKGEDVFPGAY